MRAAFQSLKLSLVSEKHAFFKLDKEEIVSKIAVLLVMIPRIWDSFRAGRRMKGISSFTNKVFVVQ